MHYEYYDMHYEYYEEPGTLSIEGYTELSASPTCTKYYNLLSNPPSPNGFFDITPEYRRELKGTFLTEAS